MPRVGDAGEWFSPDRPREPGAAVVFDIDGVLSDASGRQHFLDGPDKDWGRFFEASVDDPPLADGIALLRLLGPELRRVLVTARPARLSETTLTWLARHDLPWDLLTMRADDDLAASPNVKRRVLDQLLDHGYAVELAIDDDPRNIEMYRSQGVTTLYRHSGYY